MPSDWYLAPGCLGARERWSAGHRRLGRLCLQDSAAKKLLEIPVGPIPADCLTQRVPVQSGGQATGKSQARAGPDTAEGLGCGSQFQGCAERFGHVPWRPRGTGG